MPAVSLSNIDFPRNAFFAPPARSRSQSSTPIAIGIVLFSTVPSLGPALAQDSPHGPITGRATAYELSVPVGKVAPAREQKAPAFNPPRINPLADEPDEGRRGTWTRKAVPLDPLVRRSQNRSRRTPRLDLRFMGTGNPRACNGCTPPDTIGDVGPRHYVQMVNATKVTIFDKSGNRLQAPFNLGTLWSSGECSGNAGDPVVLYDEFADRWLLAQFAFPTHLCFAISRRGNPRGAYHLYTFDVGKFPDYFKVGVWPNGYYVSANENSPEFYSAYAFDRRQMLRGDPNATFVKFTGENNFLMPADVDGPNRPAGGGLFYTFKDDVFHGGDDRIELFRLRPDFATPANSTFRLIKTIPIASFAYTVCGFFNLNCIRQQGTSQQIDAVSEWPMQRFVYRKFSNREVLVGNFTVGGGMGETGAAIRWFELRKGSRNWRLFQEGTHDPGDGHDRFMGSIAIDQRGNIALGYSVSSSSILPSIRYVVRRPADPLGTMGRERTLKAGGGAQLGSNRWGDYTAMSVDPSTGCRFWYTNEFYRANSQTTWKTIIGAFTNPNCP